MSATLPLVDLDDVPPRAFARALVRHGAAQIRSSRLRADDAQATLDDAAAFFSLSDAAKDAIHIRHSPHFRGYSVMRNARDFREQIHFGRERHADGSSPPWRTLSGPNLWPDVAGLRSRALRWMQTVEHLANTCLAKLATAFALHDDAFVGRGEPYLLTKWIHYDAQPSPTTRPGVAPHLDFSLLTLTLQDDVGGLEVRSRNGRWIGVEPIPATLLVHVGEVLAFTTGQRLVATPHRVVNRSMQRARVSVPVFVCPDLRATVTPLLPLRRSRRRSVDALADGAGDRHVHHVLAPDAVQPFHFGEAEWQRKGRNVWCATCVGQTER